MSKNIDQIYIANPITSNNPTDKMYFGVGGVDAAMEYSDFAAQLSGATPTEVQQSAFNIGLDTGTADNYIITLSPVPGSLTDGMFIIFTPANANATGSPLATVNGFGPYNINIGLASPNVGDLVVGIPAILQYSATETAFELINPQVSFTSPQGIAGLYYNAGNDSGSSNAYALTILPTVTYTDGLTVTLLATANNNTGASTLNVNTLGNVNIVNLQGAALSGGEMLAGYDYTLQYNAANTWFVLQNSSAAGGGGVTSTQVQQSAFNYGTDIGIADAYVIDLTPVVISYTDGLLLSFTPQNANLTTSPTIALNSLSSVPVVLPNLQSVLPGDFLSSTVFLMYSNDIGGFILLNPRNSFVSSQEIQTQGVTSASDSGSTNGYQAIISPNVASLTNGLTVTLLNVLNSNTGSSTIRISGATGFINIVNLQGQALVGGEILAGYDYTFQYNSANNWFVLQNSSLPVNLVFSPTYDTSSSTTDYTGSTSPTIPGYVDGMLFLFKPANTNTTTTPTLNLDSLGAITITRQSGIAIVIGDMVGGQWYQLVYNATTPSFQLMGV